MNADREARPNELLFTDILIIIFKNRRLLVVIPAVVFTVIILFTLIQPRTYTASASLMPQVSNSEMSLTAGLAAQFGINMPGGIPSQSSDFYADLITTSTIMKAIVGTHFSFSVDSQLKSGNLVELFKVKSSSFEIGRELAVKKLEKAITINAARKTDVVTFTVTTRWAPLSALIGEKILKLLNEFNLAIRQSQAGNEQAFIEERLEAVHAELRTVEDELQTFLQKNIQYRNSPELTFIYERLQRNIMMRQQVVTTLTQAYEQARIESVRNTPIINIVEQPSIPVLADRRHLIQKGIIGIVIGVILGTLMILWRELTDKSYLEDIGKSAIYKRLKKETLHDLLHPWRLLIKL